jgi:hypothetical protein
MVSDKMKPVYVNGDRLESVAYIYQGETFFPVREIIIKLGGSVCCDGSTIFFSYKGIDYTMKYHTIFYVDEAGEEQSLNMEGKYALNYYATCFTEDVFRDVFEIMISYDEDKDCYTANPVY